MDLSEKNIKLVELANTWQGEGPDTGRQMLIARFKYCDRFCKFCDTWIKMKTSAEGSYSIDDINKALEKTRGLMITGGEPTFQKDKITNLEYTVLMMKKCDCQIINVETNGFAIENLLNLTVKDSSFGSSAKTIHIMYSPKIFSEKEYDIEIKRTANVIDCPNVYLKVVADGNQWSEKYIREISRCENKGKIFLMPLGITAEEIMKNWSYCIDMSDELNLNLSTRMHITNQFT